MWEESNIYKMHYYLHVRYVPLSFCQIFNFWPIYGITVVLLLSGLFLIKQNAFYTLLDNRIYKYQIRWES